LGSALFFAQALGIFWWFYVSLVTLCHCKHRLIFIRSDPALFFTQALGSFVRGFVCFESHLDNVNIALLKLHKNTYKIEPCFVFTQALGTSVCFESHFDNVNIALLKLHKNTYKIGPCFVFHPSFGQFCVF
jgi:hypothetical protein